jgi:hypothetical protein
LATEANGPYSRNGGATSGCQKIASLHAFAFTQPNLPVPIFES